MRSIFRNEIAKELPSREGAWIADIPAGGGVLWHGLEKEGGWRLVFVDIRTPAEKNGLFVQADCKAAFPFRSDTFSLLVSTEGIEHFSNPHHFASELFRILEPGGKLLISTPNIANLSSRLQFFLRGKYAGCTLIAKTVEDFSSTREYERFLCGEHVSPLSYAQLFFVLTKAGFRIFAQKGLAIKGRHYLLTPVAWAMQAMILLGVDRLLPEQARLRRVMARTDMLLGKHIWVSAVKPPSMK